MVEKLGLLVSFFLFFFGHHKFLINDVKPPLFCNLNKQRPLEILSYDKSDDIRIIPSKCTNDKRCKINGMFILPKMSLKQQR